MKIYTKYSIAMALALNALCILCASEQQNSPRLSALKIQVPSKKRTKSPVLPIIPLNESRDNSIGLSPLVLTEMNGIPDTAPVLEEASSEDSRISITDAIERNEERIKEIAQQVGKLNMSDSAACDVAQSLEYKYLLDLQQDVMEEEDELYNYEKDYQLKTIDRKRFVNSSFARRDNAFSGDGMKQNNSNGRELSSSVFSNLDLDPESLNIEPLSIPKKGMLVKVNSDHTRQLPAKFSGNIPPLGAPDLLSSSYNEDQGSPIVPFVPSKVKDEDSQFARSENEPNSWSITSSFGNGTLTLKSDWFSQKNAQELIKKKETAYQSDNGESKDETKEDSPKIYVVVLIIFGVLGGVKVVALLFQKSHSITLV